MEKILISAALVAAVLGLTACSSEAPKTTEAKTEAKKEPEIPTTPVTGKAAFYEMYTPARQWATDIQPLTLVSKEVEGIKNEGGRAAMWTATFASPSLRAARVYDYSIKDQGPDISKGVKAEPQIGWTGPTQAVMPFQLGDFSVDSDAAYSTAAAKAGTWLKDHPDKPVSMTLGLAQRFPNPVWYILWGTPKDGYAVYVNATSGEIVTR